MISPVFRAALGKVLLVLSLTGFGLMAEGAPADQLAPIPEATQVEKEVIGLLQIDRTSINSGGNVFLSLYNPSKYTLKNCAVRLQIPSMKIDRVYFSGDSTIAPLHNGEFCIPTEIENVTAKDLKCEIIKVSLDKVKG